MNHKETDYFAGVNRILKNEANETETVGSARLTIGAVLILGSIDGAIWLHLQLEALATGEPGHNAL